MLHAEQIFFISLTSFMGLLLGSFANAVIYRIPREIPLGFKSNGRSFCPNCKAQIAFYDNIPVLSYLILAGKCRACSQKISFRYPLVELLTASAFALVAFVYVKEGHTYPFEHLAWVDFIRDLYFFFCLVAIIFIDLDFRIIPDRFSLGNWVIALALTPWLLTISFKDSLIGGAAGFLTFFFISWLFEKARGIQGLGFGDVKMMGWLGAWLGWVGLPLMVIIASSSGFLVGLLAMMKSKEGMQTAIPFGPFLALGAIVIWCMAKF